MSQDITIIDVNPDEWRWMSAFFYEGTECGCGVAHVIRHEVGIPVMSVGALLGADHANTVLAAGRADLAVMARPHLHDAYLTLHAAEKHGYDDQVWPGQYLLGKPRAPKPEDGQRR